MKIPWKICCVPDARSMYTYGIPELYGHPNFMITADNIIDDTKYYAHILNTLARMVANGAVLRDKDLVSEILEDYNIKLSFRHYGVNSQYLLVLIPEATGEFGALSFRSEEIFEEESARLVRDKDKSGCPIAKEKVKKMREELKNNIN